MKKVLIDAVLIGNLGDDLFVKVLLERYKNQLFSIIVSKKYSTFLNRFNNIKIIKFENTMKKLERIGRKFFNKRIIFNKYQRENDATVLISGSVFMENENYKTQIGTYKNDIKKAKNYFLLGTNFGPYKNDDFKNSFNEVFDECKDICFRDKYSYNLFVNLKNVRYAPDIVFNLDINKYKCNYNTKNVGISIIDLNNRSNLVDYVTKYEIKIVEVIRQFIKDGYTINLYSFCKEQNDELCAERIIENLNKSEREKVNRIYYDGDIDYVLENIAKDEYIIATRFHAMILGWKFRKKVYPLIYSNKMKTVIDDLGYSGKYSFINDIDLVNYNDIRKNSKKLDNIEEIEKESADQFKMLDEFLYNIL